MTEERERERDQKLTSENLRSFFELTNDLELFSFACKKNTEFQTLKAKKDS